VVGDGKWSQSWRSGSPCSIHGSDSGSDTRRPPAGVGFAVPYVKHYCRKQINASVLLHEAFSLPTGSSARGVEAATRPGGGHAGSAWNHGTFPGWRKRQRTPPDRWAFTAPEEPKTRHDWSDIILSIDSSLPARTDDPIPLLSKAAGWRVFPRSDVLTANLLIPMQLTESQIAAFRCGTVKRCFVGSSRPTSGTAESPDGSDPTTSLAGFLQTLQRQRRTTTPLHHITTTIPGNPILKALAVNR